MKTKDDILSAKTVLTAANSHDAARLFPPVAESCELTIECSRHDYSASAIARAVEDSDAHLLNLNVTSAISPVGMVIVDLRVSHRNAGRVARSLERYGYRVVSVRDGFDSDSELTARRIDELLVHIDV